MSQTLDYADEVIIVGRSLRSIKEVFEKLEKKISVNLKKKKKYFEEARRRNQSPAALGSLKLKF